MTIYAIGDLQGCLSPLKQLLAEIAFDPNRDQLLFCGDLVNRGPESLETLRYIKDLVDKGVAGTVLGNHDIHLLAVAAGISASKKGDTLDPILNSRDCAQLIDWLARQPLSITLMPAIAGIQEEIFLSHAGLYPFWSLSQAENLSREASAMLQGPERLDLLANMYGNEPSRWSDSLEGMDRIRFIINAFTRMRYVSPDGALALRKKGSPKQYTTGTANGSAPPSAAATSTNTSPTTATTKQAANTQANSNTTKAPPLANMPSQPWYELLPNTFFADSTEKPRRIIFGHWSSLEGECPHPAIEALDTGYVWSGALTALNLSNGERHQILHPKNLQLTTSQ